MTVKKSIVGIRREDKNVWEKRVPLVPSDVEKLVKKHGIKVIVQPSRDHRAFTDEAYVNAGAVINEDLSACDVILGVKEIPSKEFLDNKCYIFFSHVIKGQSYNMPMLQTILDKKCSVIDYEKIENSEGRRLIFFGRYAGLSGMVETLHALGKRLEDEGVLTPFAKIKQPGDYSSLAEIKSEIKKVGEEIHREGLPDQLKPFVCGFSGYGNVSQGAQEIFDLLQVTEVDPETIRGGLEFLPEVSCPIFKTVFYEKNMFAPVDSRKEFQLLEYFNSPGLYRSNFSDFHDKLSMLINCIYWTEECPRLLTREDVAGLYQAGQTPRLKVIGDISCDIEGSVEVTVEATDIDHPTFVYLPETGEIKTGVHGHGPVVMAIENLPCEIPVEASRDFSDVLVRFLPLIANADLTVPYNEVDLISEIKDAMIVYQGELTPDYRYISEYLTKGE